MKINRFFLLLTLVMLCQVANAQSRITGKITDKRTTAGIEYASVMLLRASDSSLAGGATTSENGSFAIERVAVGSYLLKINFVGYAPYLHSSPIKITSANQRINLGTIAINPMSNMLEETVVTAERTMVEYQLDKRVVNVDQNLVAGGGTATDILENVPSVAIDNDGNVTLRGSSNVKVLIDGRPYELMGSDLETLLEQIPASSVENIEVITNPSARYDPEGMSGIINIKLKSKASAALGTNGVLNINGGAPLPFMIPDGLPLFIPTLSGSLSLNYTTEKYSIYFTADANRRNRASTNRNNVERRTNGVAYEHDSSSSYGLGPSLSGSIKIGGEYYFNKQNSLLLSYQLRGGNRNRMTTANSTDLFSGGLRDFTQLDTNRHSDLGHTINASFIHKFANPGQQLTAEATLSMRNDDGSGWQEQSFANSNFTNYYLRETSSDNSSHNINLVLNYVHPFGDKGKLETGYEGRINHSDQNYLYYNTRYAADSSLHRQLDSISSTHYVYDQQIHAVYATFGYALTSKLSAQAGLRGEYSTVKGSDLNHPTAQPVDKPYWQLYPTLHLSYQINKSQSAQLSYSRRVRRPNVWDLNPYMNVREDHELSFGNPGIDPEYTNAIELSYNITFKQTNVFTSAYFRQTNSMMTRYGFVWDATSAAYYSPWMTYNSAYDGYWASTSQNMNYGMNYGLEFIVDQQVTKWWKVNVSVNLYKSYIEGSELLGNTHRDAFRASAKLNSNMNLPKEWTLQLSGQYRAPFFDLQTDMDASYWVDLAAKKDLWQHRATLTIRVGDLLCTGGWGHSTETDQLYRVFRSRRVSPSINVGFSYKINNGLRQNHQPVDDGYDDSDSNY